MVSCTVNEGKILATWKARPMPWRTMSGGELPARSTPLSRMRPESGFSAPVIRLKNVLLPAPLGPITAVSDPSAKSSVMSSAALTPPNDLESCCTSSMANCSPPEGRDSRSTTDSSRAFLGAVAPLLVPLDREIHQTFAQTDSEEQDHDAKHDAVILGQPCDGVVENQQQHGADHRTKEGGDAAQHIDKDALARNRPIGEFGVGARHEQAHDDAAGRGKQRRQHEDRELGAPDIDADEAGSASIVADHAQRVAERRLRDLPHQQKSNHQ